MLSSVPLAALLVCLFELGNYAVFFRRALLPILAAYKVNEAAATLPPISEANILRVVHG